MTLVLLVSVSIIAAFLAKLAPRWDAILAWIVGTVLAFCAGTYTDGFDREEYILMIENTRQLADQDLALRLFAAKDPLFLLIIQVAGTLTEDSQLVFLIVAIFASLTKVLATSAIPGKRTQFMALYTIFIAPGLEFAAIRAGIAIGLTMLGYLVLKKLNWKILCLALGLASHMSMLVITAGQIWARHWRVSLIVLVTILPFINSIIIPLIQDDPRYNFYLDNSGTPFALGLPVATLFCLLLLSQSLKNQELVRHPMLTANWIRTTYFMVGISLLLTFPIVTAATRILELAWVLLLIQMITRDKQVLYRVHTLKIASWCVLIIVLSFANIIRGTWAILI